MKQKGVIVVVLVLVSAAVLALLYMIDNSDNKSSTPAKGKKKTPKGKIVKKKNNWEKKYGHRNIDPYGTFIFYNLIKLENEKKVRVLKRSSQYEWMDTIKGAGKLYMYIGTSFPDNKFHLKRVLNMVKKGNTAFISAEVFPDRIIRMLNRTHHIYMKYDSSMSSYFEHPAFNDTVGAKFNYIYKNRPMQHYWAYFYPHRPVIMRVCTPGSNDTIIKGVWIQEGKYKRDYEDETEYDYESDDEYSYEEDPDPPSEAQTWIDSINQVVSSYNQETNTENETEQEDEEFTWNEEMRARCTEEDLKEYKTLYNDTVDIYARDKNTDVQFMSFKYGKGRIYLHSMPYVFTNVVLKNEKGVAYAERVISCLPVEDIFFDSFLASVKSTSYHKGPVTDPGYLMKRNSPLQFILSERSFRWAWYILLASLFIYILFRGKRKQKVIQPVQPVANNHMEFSNTLSKLYMQRGEPKHIVNQQERNFQFYIRRKYYMNISRSPSDEEIAQLSRKSTIEGDFIRGIYEKFKGVRTRTDTGVKELTELYQQLEYFYKNCR